MNEAVFHAFWLANVSFPRALMAAKESPPKAHGEPVTEAREQRVVAEQRGKYRTGKGHVSRLSRITSEPCVCATLGTTFQLLMHIKGKENKRRRSPRVDVARPCPISSCRGEDHVSPHGLQKRFGCLCARVSLCGHVEFRLRLSCPVRSLLAMHKLDDDDHSNDSDNRDAVGGTAWNGYKYKKENDGRSTGLMQWDALPLYFSDA